MTTQQASTGTAVVILAGVMFVTSVAGLVALVIAGVDSASLERLVGPLLTAVVITGVLGATNRQQGKRLDEQDTKLDKITHQTNGVLDRRIREGTKAALLEVQQEESGRHSV